MTQAWSVTYQNHDPRFGSTIAGRETYPTKPEAVAAARVLRDQGYVYVQVTQTTEN